MSTPNPAIDLYAETDIGAVAGAVKEVAKTVEQAVAALNTPEMVQARENVEVQKAKDAIREHTAEALATGEVKEVNKDLS